MVLREQMGALGPAPVPAGGLVVAQGSTAPHTPAAGV